MAVDLNPLIIETYANPNYAIIWMHGLGADAHDFADTPAHLKLPDDKRVRFIFPNAPVRPVTLNNGFPMRAWYDVFSLTDSHKQDETGIRESQQLIEQLIQTEIDQGIDPTHIVLAGFSQGAAMSLFAGLRYKKTLGGIIALSGYLPLHEQLKAEASKANKKTPIFMAHGSEDDIVVPTMAAMSKDYLEQLGYQVAWHVYPMTHTVCTEEMADIGKFLSDL